MTGVVNSAAIRLDEGETSRPLKLGSTIATLLDVLPILVAPLITYFWLPSAWPRWASVWVLVGVIFAGCKILTWMKATPSASFGRHVGYLFAWPGLDANAFLANRAGRVARPTLQEWCFAVFKLALGLTLLFGAARMIPSNLPYVRG